MARRETSKNPAVMSCINIKAFNARYKAVAKKRGIVTGKMSFGNAEARSKRNAAIKAQQEGGNEEF